MTSEQKTFCVHFFNSEGVPVLTIKHLTDQNTLLRSQVDRLTRMLRAQVERNRATAVAVTTQKLHS
jgi:hypothetical protein